MTLSPICHLRGSGFVPVPAIVPSPHEELRNSRMTDLRPVADGPLSRK